MHHASECPEMPGGRVGDDRGYTLVEMAVVFVVFGLILAFSVPAFQSYSASVRLKAATQVIAGELRLAREKAIATGQFQEMHFTPNWGGCGGCDYHIHNGAVVGAGGKLPKGITYQSIGVNPRMLPDGRSTSSGVVVLRDRRGNRDTISVQLSGLVLTK